MDIDSLGEVNESGGENGPPSPLIKVSVSEECIPLIWDPEDWMTLRQKHRIVGCLIGPSVPFPYSEGVNGLPMALQPWETTFLIKEGVIELVYHASLSQAPGDEVRAEFKNLREKLAEEQIDIMLRNRKEEITDKIQNITEGKSKLMSKPKKKKALIQSELEGTDKESSTSMDTSSELDASSVLREELSKVKAPSPESLSVQTFTQFPWLREEDARNVPWRYPSSSQETLLCSVFEDLWRKGYYITSGEKFGCEFLVYPGDPCKFHAHFLVVCLDKDAVICPSDITSLCRLGNSVHKTAVYASFIDGEIIYQSLTWVSSETYGACD